MKILKQFILFLIFTLALFSNQSNAQIVTLSNPDNNSIGMPYMVTLKWLTLPEATSYAVEYSINSNMTGGTTIGGITDTTFVLNDLPANSTWYWRILGVTGGTNEWSEIWNFTTMDVDIPVQASPDNNSLEILYASVDIKWFNSNGAINYSMQYSLCDDMSNSTSIGGLPDTTHTLTNLIPDTLYYWQVGASANGTFSEWSPTWNFRTKCSCTDITIIDTTTFYISDINFSSFSQSQYLYSTDSLTTTIGECDSIRNHLHKFIFEEDWYTDTIYISVTDTLIINVDILGVTPLYNTNTINIYPNPTKDIIYINTGENYSYMTDYTIKIVNTTSQTVFESLVNDQLFSIDISSFGSVGLYFIEIIDPSGQVTDTRKIILE